MIKIKPLIVAATVLIALTIMIPALVVLPFSGEKASGRLGEEIAQPTTTAPKSTSTADSVVEVSVYRTATSKIETVVMEDYLIGVVGSEMPAEFNEEALKAQALTARTYIINRMVKKDTTGVTKGEDVNDTVSHQVYKNDSELRKIWGKDYEWKKKKVLEAVRATSGQIITYKGAPIDASFFSTSNGYTENSEDYWSGSLPYLRSVPSPWDINSPKFTNQRVLSIKDFEKRLGVKVGSSGTIGKIKERTEGKRVAKVDFNGKVLSGKDIRVMLDLKSSDFSWERKGNNIVITTRGYGHGVGMSQYGANGMAEEGKNYKEIVQHYYKGIEVTSAERMMETITAQK